MNDLEIIKSAKETLTLTQQAIRRQSLNLPKVFPKIVRLMSDTKGKIIFSGVGKSGYIARKLSSTFSSVGSSSIFLHPTDANHGDMGVINKKDVIVFISNSGKSSELKNIVLFAKRKKIKTIAICSEQDGFLVKNSSHSLITLKTKEACPFDLVPTTSTSLTLAFGDALAIAVMKIRKFSREDFGTNHPGGKIGSRFIKVGNLMHTKKKIPLVSENDNMKKTLYEITRKGLGVAGVLNKKRELIGLITDGDLRRNFESILENNAKQIMTKNPVTISEDMFVHEALSLMNRKSITSLFINQQTSKRPKGIIHIHDCVRIIDNGNRI